MGDNEIARIVKVEITGDESRIVKWLASELLAAFGSEDVAESITETINDGDSELLGAVDDTERCYTG